MEASPWISWWTPQTGSTRVRGSATATWWEKIRNEDSEVWPWSWEWRIIYIYMYDIHMYVYSYYLYIIYNTMYIFIYMYVFLQWQRQYWRIARRSLFSPLFGGVLLWVVVRESWQTILTVEWYDATSDGWGFATKQVVSCKQVTRHDTAVLCTPISQVWCFYTCLDTRRICVPYLYWWLSSWHGWCSWCVSHTRYGYFRMSHHP